MSQSPGVAPVPALVTAGADAPTDGQIIVTPGVNTPNIIIKVMTPMAQILVRTLRTYLQALVALLGLMTIGKPVLEGFGVVVTPTDLVSVVVAAGGIAAFPALLTFLQNLVELLGSIEQKFPKWRA